MGACCTRQGRQRGSARGELQELATGKFHGDALFGLLRKIALPKHGNGPEQSNFDPPDVRLGIMAGRAHVEQMLSASAPQENWDPRFAADHTRRGQLWHWLTTFLACPRKTLGKTAIYEAPLSANRQSQQAAMDELLGIHSAEDGIAERFDQCILSGWSLKPFELKCAAGEARPTSIDGKFIAARTVLSARCIAIRMSSPRARPERRSWRD